MRIYIIHLLMVCSCVVYSANPTGRWTFDDPENMLKATIGTDLEQIGSVTATYTTGPTATNKAIQVPKGTYFKSTHGIITPNGGGNYINEYSIMFDVRIPITTSGWMALFNANAYNGNNAECYISPEGTIGLGATGGYSDFRMQRNDWYRVIITVDLGSSHRYYIDGQLVKEGTAQSIDGSFSLDPVMSFFSDKGGDDDPIDVAEISIWGNILTPEEITILGGYEHNTPEPTTLIVNPYLQSPSQNSVIISWHGSATDTHTLRYGQSTTLDKTANNSAQIVEAGYIWHTANLTNLEPNTAYYYQIEKNGIPSKTFTFKTQSLITDKDKIRFLLIGDTQDHATKNKEIVSAITAKVREIYNDSLHNVFDAFIHVGDLVGSGSTISQYTDQFFTPFAPITASVPTLITAGNHELEHKYFYKYIFNDEISGQPATHPDFERYWSKQMGNTLLVGLNSTDQPSLQGIFVEQEAWLKKTLDAAEADETIDFVFCFIHAPAMSEMWGQARHSFTANKVLPLIRKYSKVQQLTSGHTHAYERGMISKTGDAANSSDITLLIAGGGGGTRDRWGEYTNQDYPEIHTTLERYFYVIAEIDPQTKSYTFKTYSLGNNDYPLNNELIDEWIINPGLEKPETPKAESVSVEGNIITLSASAYKGVNSQFSSEFEVVEISGDIVSKVLSASRDSINFYEATQDFAAINKNEGINLASYKFNKILLNSSLDSKWRVRYRDINQRWSNWSEYQPLFTYSSIKQNNTANSFSYLGNGNFLINEPGNFSMYNLSGKKIYQKLVTAEFTHIHISLQKGIYLIKTNNNNSKIIVK